MRIVEPNAQNEEQHQHVSKMNTLLEEKETKVNALSSSLKELVIENETISQTLEKSRQEIKCLSDQISALSMENDLLNRSKEELEMCSLNKDNDIVVLSNAKQNLVASVQQYEKKVNVLGCELQLKQTDNANAEALVESKERDLQAMRGTCEERSKRNDDLEKNISSLESELQDLKLGATKLLRSEEEKITNINCLEQNFQELVKANETECNTHKVTEVHLEEATATIDSLKVEMKKIVSEHENKILSLLENLNVQSQQIEKFEKEITNWQEDSKQKAEMFAEEKDKYESENKQVNIILEEKDANLNSLMENLELLSQKLNESEILCNSKENEIDHLKHLLQHEESEIAEVNIKVCKLNEELQTLNQQKDEQMHLLMLRAEDIVTKELMINTLQNTLAHSEEKYNHIQFDMADVIDRKDKVIMELDSCVTDKTECLVNESRSSLEAAKRAEHEITKVKDDYRVISEQCEKLEALCIEKDSSHSTLQRDYDSMLMSFQELENNHATLKLEISLIEENALLKKQELDQLKDIMKLLLEEKKAVECQLEEKTDLVKSLNHVTEALDETVVRLQDTLKEKEADLQDYATQLMDVKQQMEKICAEKDLYVLDCKKLTVAVEEKNAQLDGLTGNLVSLSENLNESEDLCKIKQGEIESFKNKLIEKEAEAQQYQNEICNLKHEMQIQLQQIDGHIINIKQKDEDLIAADEKNNDVRKLLNNLEAKYKVLQTEMANALVEKDKVISLLEIALCDKTECLLKETESSQETAIRTDEEMAKVKAANGDILDHCAKLEALCIERDSINAILQKEYDSLQISFQELQVNLETVQLEQSAIEETASLAKNELRQLKEVMKSLLEEKKSIADQLEEKTDLVKSLNHVTEALDETIVKYHETMKVREDEMKERVNQLLEAKQQMEEILSEKDKCASDLKQASISLEEKCAKLDALMENLDMLSENLKEAKMLCATKESQVDFLTNQLQAKDSHFEQLHDENNNIKQQLQTLKHQNDEQNDIIKQMKEDLFTTESRLNDVQKVLADTEDKYNLLQLEMNDSVNSRDNVISDLEMSLAEKTESHAKEYQSSQETAIRTKEEISKVKAEHRDIMDHSAKLEALCIERDSINATLEKEYDSLQVSFQELQVKLETVQLEKSVIDETASLAKNDLSQLKEVTKSLLEEKKFIEDKLEEKTDLVKSLNHVTETLDKTIVKSEETLKAREDEMKKLVDQLVESKQKMEGVLSEKEKCASDLKQANISIEEKGAKLDALMGNVDMLSEHLKESKLLYTTKQSEIDSLTNQLQEKESHLEQLHDEHSHIKQRLQTLQQQNDEQSDIIKQREEDLLAAKSRINDVQTILSDTQEKYNILQLEMNEGVNSRDNVISDLEMSLADKTEYLAKESQCRQEAVSRTEEEMTKVKADNCDILEKHTNLEALCSEKDSINVNLQKEYDSSQMSLQELQVNLETMQLEKTSIEEIASLVKDELSQLKEVIKSLLEEKISVEDQLEEKRDLVKTLNHVTETLDENIVKFQETLKEREGNMKEFENQLMISKQQMEGVVSEKDKCVSDLKQANISLEEKNVKLDALMENLDKISEHMNEAEMLRATNESQVNFLANQLQEKESHLEQIHDVNKSIKQQLQTLQQQNDEQSDIIKQREEDLLTTKTRGHDVQTMLDESEEKYQLLQLEMNEGVINRDKVICVLEMDLADKTESLASEYRSSQETSKRTNEEIAKVKSEHSDILDHSAMFEALCIDKDSINATLQKEYDSLHVSFQELQVNLETVQFEKSTMEETASLTKNELSQLKEAMKSLLEENMSIEDKLEEKTDLVKSLNHVTETLDETIMKSQETLKQREDELKELVNQLMEGKEQMERDLSQKEKCEIDLKQANISLEEKSAKLDGLMGNIDMLSEHLKDSKLLCTIKQSEIDSLTNQLQEEESNFEHLHDEHGHMKLQFQTLQQQNDEQSDIIKRREEDLLATDAKVTEVQKELTDSEEKYKLLQLEMNETVDTKDQVISDLQICLTDKTESLAKEYQSSLEAAKISENEIKCMKEEKNYISEQMMISKLKLEEVIAENDKFKSIVNQLNIILEEKDAKLEALMGNLDMLSMNINDSETMCKAQQNEVNAIESKLVERDSELEHTVSELKNLQQEYQRHEQKNDQIIKQRDEDILAAETNMADVQKTLANTEEIYRFSQGEINEKNRVISELEISLQETSDCFTKERLLREEAVMIAKEELDKVQVDYKVVTDKVSELETMCIEKETIQVSLQNSLQRSEAYQENVKLEHTSVKEESHMYREEINELRTAMKSLEMEKECFLKQLADKTDQMQHVSEMSDGAHVKAQESMRQMTEDLKSLEEKLLDYENKMGEVVAQKDTCLQETRHLNVIVEEKETKLQVLAENIELLIRHGNESDILCQSLHEENQKLQETKSISDAKAVELQNNVQESKVICEKNKAQSNDALQNKDAIICDLENCLEAERVQFGIFKNDMYADLQNKVHLLSKHGEVITNIEQELLVAHDKMGSLGNVFESKISKLFSEKGVLVSDLERSRIHVSELNEQVQQETTKCEMHFSDVQTFKKQLEDVTAVNTLQQSDICEKNKSIEILSSSVQQLQFEATETESKMTELTHNLGKQLELFHLRECSAADVDAKLLSLLDEAEVHKNELYDCNIHIDSMERKLQNLENRLQEKNDEQAEASKLSSRQQQSIGALEGQLCISEKHADMLLKTLTAADNSLQKLQFDIEKLENENNSLLLDKKLLNSSISDKELVKAKLVSQDNIIDDQRVEITNLQSLYIDVQTLLHEKELSLAAIKQDWVKHESEQNEILEKYQQLLSEQEESAKLVNIELCAFQDDQADSKTIMQELQQKLDYQIEVTRNMKSAASEYEQHRIALLEQNASLSRDVSNLQISKDEMMNTCDETKNELLVKTDAKIASLNLSLNSAQQRLAELETMLKDKMEHIQEMEDNIHEVEIKNSQHVERLQALHSECEEKDIDLKRLNQSLAETKNELEISVCDNTSLQERLLNESDNLQRNTVDEERIASDWQHAVDTKEQELCETKLEFETCQKQLKTYKLKVEESVTRLDLKDSQLISMNEMAMQVSTDLEQARIQVDTLQTVISKHADTIELHQQEMKVQQEKAQLLLDALQNLQQQNQSLLEKHDIRMEKDEHQTNLLLDLQKQLSENEAMLNSNVRKLEVRELQCKKAIAAMKKFKFDLQERTKETNTLKGELEQSKQNVEELQLLLNEKANNSEELVHELQSVRDATSDTDRAEDDSVPTVNILDLELDSLKSQLSEMQDCCKIEAKRNKDLQNELDILTERLESKQTGDSENEKELVAQVQTYGEYCQQLQDQVELLTEQQHESTKVGDRYRSEEDKRNAEIQELVTSFEQQTEKCSTLESKLKKRDSEIQELENLLEQESGYEIQANELEARLEKSDELCQSQIQLLREKELKLQELLVIRSDLDVKIGDMKYVEEQLQQEIYLLQSHIDAKNETQQADMDNLQQTAQQLQGENEELPNKVLQEEIVEKVSAQEESSLWEDIALPEVSMMLSNVEDGGDANISVNGKDLPVAEKISETFERKVFAERDNSLTANPETLSKLEINDSSEPNISELPSEIDRQVSVKYAIDGANDSNVPSMDFEVMNAVIDDTSSEGLQVEKKSMEQPDEISVTIRNEEVLLHDSRNDMNSLLEEVKILELHLQERDVVYEDQKLQFDKVAIQLSILQSEKDAIVLDLDNLQQLLQVSQTELKESTLNLEANEKQRDDLTISLNQISDERNKLRQALEEALSEILSLNEVINKNNVALSDANNRINSMVHINEIESFKMEMESFKSEKNSLTDEIEELQSALKEIENRNEFLASKLEDTNLQITMMEESQVLKDNIIEQRSQEIISMQTNYEELCASLETKYNESTSKIFQLETQLIESEEVNACLRTQHDSVKMIYEQLTVDNAALQEQLKNISLNPPKESTDQINFEVKMNETIVHEPLRQTDNQTTSGTNEYDELKISHQSLLDEHERVRSKLKLTEIKCQKMLIKLKSFKDKNDSLQNEMSSLKQQSKSALEDHQFHLAQLKDTCEQLDRQLIEEVKKNGCVNSKYKDEQDLSLSLQNQIHVHIADLQQSESNVEKALKEKETLSVQLNEQKLHYDNQLVQVAREHQISKDKLMQLDVEVNKLTAKSMSEQSIFDIEIERISHAAKEEKLLCERQLHESNEQQRMLLSDNDEYGRMVKELQTANGRLRMEKDRLATVCSELESNTNDANYAEKMTECEKLKDDLHGAKLETQILKDDLENLNIKISEVLSAKDAEITDLTVQLQVSKDDLREKQVQADCLLSNFNAEKQILQNEIDSITQSLADEKMHFIGQEKDTKEQYNMLLSDNEEYQHLVQTLQENMKKTKAENDELRFKLKRLDTSNNQSLPDKDKDTSDLEARFKDLNSEHDYLLEEMEEMRREILNGKKEKQRLVENLEDTVTKDSVEHQSKDDNSLNVDQLQTQNKALRDKLGGLEWKLDEISGLEEQIEDLNSDLSTQRKIVSDLNIQLNEKQLENNSLHEEINSLNNQEKSDNVNVSGENDFLNIAPDLSITSNMNSSEYAETIDKLNIENCMLRVQINDIQIRFQDLREAKDELKDLKDKHNKAAQTNISNSNVVQSDDEVKVNGVGNQMEYHLASKDVSENRILQLEKQSDLLTDENIKLKQQIVILEGEAEINLLESNALRIQEEQKESSDGDGVNKFHDEYMKLNELYTILIQEKGRIQLQLNMANHSLYRREGRCQQLATQVSQLTEDRSYLNIQLANMSKALRGKEQALEQLQSQYRALHLSHSSIQSKAKELEQRVVNESVQRSSASPVGGSPSEPSETLKQSLEDKAQVEQLNRTIHHLMQRLQQSEEVQKEIMQRHVAMETTMIRDKDLQLQEAERQRDEAMEQYSQLQQTMLIDQNRQMLLNQSMEEHRMTMPTEYREVHVQMEDQPGSKMIPETSKILTRKGRGYFQRVRRWFWLQKAYSIDVTEI